MDTGPLRHFVPVNPEGTQGCLCLATAPNSMFSMFLFCQDGNCNGCFGSPFPRV